MTDILTRRALTWATTALGASVHALVVTQPQRHLFGACGERVKVYWAKDDHRLGADLYGIPTARIILTENRLAAEANTLLVASPELERRWRRRGHNPILFSNGCDFESLTNTDATQAPKDVKLPRPIVGFVGTLSDRVDGSLLLAIAEQGHSLLLVGEQRHLSSPGWLNKLCRRPNVQWVGGQRFADLIPYLKIMDVGIVPYRETLYNDASFPLKILEYLATGIPVVSTDLKSVRWLNTQLISVASSASQFVTAIDRALAAPVEGMVASRQRFAAQHDWSRRGDQLVQILHHPSAAMDAAENDQA